MTFTYRSFWNISYQSGTYIRGLGKNVDKIQSIQNNKTESLYIKKYDDIGNKYNKNDISYLEWNLYMEFDKVSDL